ncbi:hypothetical protein HDR61_03410 [bacterium]|nr:hypothetical protein [bacterium]
MLEYLRNAAEKPVAKILIGILAFSFVGWGVAEWIFGGAVGDNVLVRVGGQKVNVTQYNQVRAQEMGKLSKEQQRVVYTDAAAGAEFADKVMARLTSEAMAEARARDLGFVVTNARIAREIRELPEFQQNGKFSPFWFDYVLSNTGYTEDDYANYLRAQDLRTMVLGGLNVDVPVPEFAVMAAYNARYVTRDIEYATVRFADFQAQNPTDDDLREFYAQNPHVIEETRTVSYVLVPAEMNKPDQYDAALVRAQAMEDDIIGGETLSTAAKKHGARYVSLGTFDREHRPVDAILSDQMVANIFDMAEGTESELLETNQGFVIARVEQVIPRHNAEFDSVKAGLVNDWRTAQQRKQAYVRANEMLTAVRAGEKTAGITAKTISRTSGAPLKVLTAAYGANAGDKIIVEDDNAFYVLDVKNENMPAMDNAKKAALRKEMQNMSTHTVADDYDSFLKREYPVKVNKRVYDRVVTK